MSIWLGVGAVIVVVLIAVVVVGGRRPHSAEVELGQPKSRPAPAGAPASLDPSSLRDWLLAAPADRATGPLQGTARSQTCPRHFPFRPPFPLATGALEGTRLVVDQAEAQLHDPALARAKRCQDVFDFVAEHGLAGRLERCDGLLVFDEVTQVRILFLADRRLEGHRLLRDLLQLPALSDGDAHAVSDP